MLYLYPFIMTDGPSESVRPAPRVAEVVPPPETGPAAQSFTPIVRVQLATRLEAASRSFGFSPETLAAIDDVKNPGQRQQLFLLVYERALRGSDFGTALYCLEKIRHLEGQDTPELAIENAKLHMLMNDYESAYRILRNLCEGFTVLTQEQAHEALWYLFKSHRLGQITVSSKEEFHGNLQLLIAIERHFGVSFQDIIPAVQLGETFRRGDAERESNAGNFETGYDETIRCGEEMGAQENWRIEVERLRLMGAAYTVLADHVHQEYIDTYEGNLPEKNAALREKQKALAEKAVKATHASLKLVSNLPLLDAEAGEPLRIKYNLAKASFLLAAACPGDFDLFSRACVAIEEAKRSGREAGNQDLVAFAELVHADLLRYGGGAEGPGEQQLTRAIKLNGAALETGSQNPVVILSALVNIGQIYMRIGNREEAVQTFEAAEKKYFEEGGDERVTRVIERPLRNACRKLGMSMRIPKVTSFRP